MTQLVNTFEGGSDETTITSANSGGGSGDAFDTAHINIGSNGGVLVFDTALAAHGAYSARVNSGTSGNQSTNVGWDDSTISDPSTHYGRFYLYIATIQGTARTILARFTGNIFLEMTSAGKFRIRDVNGFGSDSTSTISTGKWVRFEYKLVHSATVGEFTVRYFDTADSASHDDQVSITSGNTGTDPEYSIFGAILADANQELWVDTLVAGATDWVGPASPPTNEAAATPAGTSTVNPHRIDAIVEIDAHTVPAPG